MTTEPSETGRPVYVGPLDFNIRERQVRVIPAGGGAPATRACANDQELRDFVEEVRPGTDLTDEAGQVAWVDYPWQWSELGQPPLPR